ncbi:MAG: hypothetical protein QGH60_12170 [Phycisphaerae bacterium]|jgi:exonuclease VII large subunit|nr:hypothetical protein [Phycisphaerae bacterium]
MAKSNSKPQSPADALSDLVAAAKAPTTAKAAAVASTSQSDQPQPPQTVAEARARSQRGLELLTNVIKALEDASRTITVAGKHTRSAIDNTFKLSHAKLETAAENVKRSADSVASTNNRMAATIKKLGTVIQNLTGSITGGIDPADLAELKGQLTTIRDTLANLPAPPEASEPAIDIEAVTELLQPLKTTVEEALTTANNQSDQTAQTTNRAAQDLKEFTRLIEGRTGKLTILVFLSLACSIFAALCAFAGILTMLLKAGK